MTWPTRSTDGSIPGLNLGLSPRAAANSELGLKAGNRLLHADLAAFYVQTQDELADAGQCRRSLGV